MKIMIDITSDEAETILFALKLRASQAKLLQDLKDQAESIRQRLNTEFERTFGWDVFPERHKADKDFRVNITNRFRW